MKIIKNHGMGGHRETNRILRAEISKCRQIEVRIPSLSMVENVGGDIDLEGGLRWLTIMTVAASRNSTRSTIYSSS
jgi:hypothetical protein